MSGTDEIRGGRRHRRRSNTKPDLSELSPQELLVRARDIVVRQLTMMDRSRAQLLEAMTKRGIPEDIAEETLDKFEQAGLVDDAHFADVFTRMRFREKAMSRRAIVMDLERKGIARPLAEDAVQQIAPEEELAAATDLARRKLARGGDDQAARRRAYAMLARRGFSPSQCSQALKQAAQDLHSTSAGEGDADEDAGLV